MDALGWHEALYCALVVTVAFAVRGGAGFGGGAVAVPLLALVLPLPLVVPVVAVLNMLSSIGHGVRDWRLIAWREVIKLLPFTLAGVGVGITLLANLDAGPLARGLGAFVMLYALYVLLADGRAPAVPRRWLGALGAVLSAGAGFVGALFGGAAGPLYVIYLRAVGLTRDPFRVTITTIMLVQGLSRIAGYAALGLYGSGPALAALAAALPLMVLGSWIGARLAGRYDQAKFNRAVGCVLLVSGAALLLK
jgi:uncharacterized membrane protein YfcA